MTRARQWPVAVGCEAQYRTGPMTDFPAVETKGLARRHGGRWALRGLDFRLERGRALMVFGHNGAGKTTLIRLLGTALRPTAGKVSIFGQALGEEVRPRIAMLSHADHHYDDLSAWENLQLAVRLGPDRGGDARAVLEEVGLGDRADDVVGTFSAGMRKRLAFARLMWKNADLVLLDEPYAGLDPAGARLVDSLILRLKERGTTVMVSTHQVDRMAALCDDALLLEGGRLKWFGPASEAPERLASA